MNLPRMIAFAIAALVAGNACAASLVPPPGFYAPVGNKGKDGRPCEDIPSPFTAPLDFPSKYQGTGASKDVINPKAFDEYKSKTEPINTMEKSVSAMVGSYLHSGQADTLECALNWYDAWAKAGALTGPAKNHTGKSVRKWALGSLASAWDRLKFSSSHPLKGHEDQAKRIEKWLSDVGTLVMADWKDQPRELVNNHQYWAAWAAMADAIALDRRDLFDWAVAEFRFAAHQVDREGYLSNELKRDTRALAYHNYALAPLVMIAAFAKANGVDLTAENDGALKRLAGLVIKGIDDPSMFEDKTGDSQVTDDLKTSSKFAWLEPYCRLYACDAALSKRTDSMRPLKTYRLGGDLTDLFGPPPTATGDKPAH